MTPSRGLSTPRTDRFHPVAHAPPPLECHQLAEALPQSPDLCRTTLIPPPYPHGDAFNTSFSPNGFAFSPKCFTSYSCNRAFFFFYSPGPTVPPSLPAPPPPLPVAPSPGKPKRGKAVDAMVQDLVFGRKARSKSVHSPANGRGGEAGGSGAWLKSRNAKAVLARNKGGGKGSGGGWSAESSPALHCVGGPSAHSSVHSRCVGVGVLVSMLLSVHRAVARMYDVCRV